MAHIKIALTNLGKYNEGILDYVWLELPATEEELDDAYDKIEVCHGDKMYYDEAGNPYEEVFISDYETDLGISIGEYDSIENLNEIAEQVDNLDEYDLKVFKAACEAGYCNEEDITSYFNPDDYRLIEGASTDQDVAYDYIDAIGGEDQLDDETLQNYFDYDAYGRDIRLEFYAPDWLDVDEDDEEEVARVCEEYGVDSLDDIDAYVYYNASSDSDIGYEVVDQLGWEGVGKENLERYFDYDSFGRDLAMDGAFVEDGFIMPY
jgi:antirestriction protein